MGISGPTCQGFEACGHPRTHVRSSLCIQRAKIICTQVRNELSLEEIHAPFLHKSTSFITFSCPFPTDLMPPPFQIPKVRHLSVENFEATVKSARYKSRRSYTRLLCVFCGELSAASFSLTAASLSLTASWLPTAKLPSCIISCAKYARPVLISPTRMSVRSPVVCTFFL